MNALTYYEPHKLSAGALALVVHAFFFSLLYFSINWHVKTPPNMVVEMWDKLPDQVVEVAPLPTAPPPPPPPPAPVIPKVEKAVAPKVMPKVIEPVAPKKADIEFKEKKKTVPPPLAPKKEPAAKAPPKPDDSAVKQAAENQRQQEAQQKLDKQHETTEQAAQEEERIQQRRAKMHADIDADSASEVAKYTDLIRAKISRNINLPPDVAENAEAVFLVTMLPGGLVMDNVKLVKSSGNAAYDNAAERAIYKAQPLPIPPDPELARVFHELRLSVKPVNH